MSIVDAWAQITTERLATAPWMETLWRWTGRQAHALVCDTHETIAAMDEAGVEIALLSAWYGPQQTLISNAEVGSQIDAAPDRFRGLLSVDVTRPLEATRTIRDLYDGERFVGARIVPWLWNLTPDDRLFYPIYATCADLGIPVCTQIGHTGPLMPSEPGRPIPYLERVLLDFPELIIVGGHVGFPWITEVMSLMVKFPNFYVDTSAYVVRRLPADFLALMKGVGAKRIMFGTNWPMLSPRDCLSGLDALELSASQRENFLSANARRVFRLPKD